MFDLKENKSFTGYEIAVIGMAGRFPGAGSIAEFWENLKNGRESIRFFSDEELAEAGITPGLTGNPHYVKARGIIEDVDYFDASFFNYTLPEAEMMDPQMRMLHQFSWQALEDAGCNPDTYEGLIGFYAGAGTHYYWIARVLDQARNPSEQFGLVSVNEGAMMSTQIAYRLNLKGPAITLQTACSTSLVAVHTACQALLAGECDMALAGGVSVRLPFKTGYMYQEGMVLSPDGHCRAFDAKAAGCIDSSGVGIVVLKPLEHALKDRDHLYALVKGTAVNNDGNRRVGFLAPSVKGQAEVIRMAHQAAEVKPASITYIETHGTGTALGDPVEIRALVQAFDTEEKQFCRIGSVKSNMGHLDAAAGVTGFIKTVLALYHKMIPPTLHFQTPNREIDFENSPFIVNTELTEWKNNHYPLRAGVSSFGIGGTNAHVILEEWPAAGGPGNMGEPLCSPPDQGTIRQRYRLVLLSGRTGDALERNTRNLAEHLKENPGIDFADAVYTLQAGRKAFEYRRTLVCRDAAEAVAILSQGSSKKLHTHRITDKNPPLVFMFPGLGSQYVNMGYDLYNNEPVFRKEMDHCFDILRPILGYDLEGILYPDLVHRTLNPNEFNQPGISQLVIFVFEYALAKLLMEWGIRPDAMIGYSFGEYTAACVSGVFTLEDALKLIVHRGALINKTPAGAMSSVPLPREELLPLLHGREELSLAIDNGPSCIIAGTQGAIAAFEKELKQKKYLCMRLNTAHAIHSTLMDSISAEFEAKARAVPVKEPQIPYISNLTGRWITAAEALDPVYWVRHLVRTVRFADGIAELVKEPKAVFLELGPGRDLSTLIRRSLGKNQQAVDLVRPLQKEISDSAFLLDRLGRLWLYGREINWQGFYEGKGEARYRVPLPAYSFERQKFALEGGTVEKGPAPEISRKYERTRLPDDYAPPRDEMETIIAAAFRDIFGLDRIGIHDDFFELGGDSLKVITLVTRLNQQLDVDIPMEAVFKNPTLKELAGYTGKKAVRRIFSTIPAVEEKEYYPLSPSQMRVFIMEQIEEKGMAYNQPTVTWLEGELDTGQLEKVYKQLLQRHESLRTGFFSKDGVPVQKVYRLKDIAFEVEHLDIAGVEAGARQAEIERLIAGFVQPFDLSAPPLWQVGLVAVSANKYLLLDMIHHIVSDDISIGVLMTEISLLYKEGSLQPLPVQYKDYAVWREETAAADIENTLKKQEAFWLECFPGKGGLPVLEMPFDYPRPPVRCFDGAHLGFIIDKEGHEKLKDLAQKNKTTLFTLLFTLYNTLLYSYTGQEDIIVGIPITGRLHRDVQEVVGMFVNTLALRNFPGGNKTFETFLQEVKEDTLQAFANQLYQFEDLVEKLDIPRDLGRNPLFDVMFILHTVDMERIQLPGVKLRFYEFEHPACRFDLTLSAAESSGGLNIALEYAAALFKKETMRQFLEDFLYIVETVTANPQVRLDELYVHPVRKKQEEKKRILYEFNNTSTDYPGGKTLKELLEDRSSRTPGNVAVIGAKAARGLAPLSTPVFRITMTYSQLNEKSNFLAHRLRRLGAAPGTVIALLADRTVEMVIGLAAVLKSGAAYLPIGPEYPAERVRYMIQHTETPIILATEAAIPFEHTLQIIDLAGEMDNGVGEGANLPSTCAPTDLAYVIYTSGTTGIPKGVMIENRSVINFIEGIAAVIPFTGHDSILSLTTLAFDIFGLETLLPLTKGSAVVIGSMEEQLNAAAAGAAIEREKITILQATPARLKLFISDPDAVGSLRRLSYLLVGGEAFPMSLLEKARDVTRGKIYNLYGPTETTIWSCIKDVTGENALNIGKPMANTRIYIVDRGGNLLPIGAAGELCISGHGVARGYFKDEPLTREKFSENPFIPDGDRDRAGHLRLYRTGDLARWLPDGNIEFMGRIDHQVKIRGFRIEPEEIEHRLVGHETIKEAVVMTKEEENGDLDLWAYIVSDGEPEISRLREFLAKDLPDYMIPPYFVKVEQIPLTPNGKVDRKALRDMEGAQLEARAAYVPPQTDLEKTIVDTWKEILNLEKVGIEDNFFDLGGTSLKVIMTVSRLKEVLQRDIPVVAMFRYSTIGSLANFLSGEQMAPRRKDRTVIKKKGRERLSRKRNLKR